MPSPSPGWNSVILVPVRRTLILVALMAVIGGIIFVTSPEPKPPLRYDETVPADLRALAEETWNDFLEAHPARWGCIPPVTLQAAWELDNRGEYHPGSATIVVRVPGTPATLRSELIHEFAHHVEFTCSEQNGLRADFLQSQGFPITADWFDADSWETTPSEQYAEATVELVLGRRSHRGGIQITPEAIEILRAWGQGS